MLKVTESAVEKVKSEIKGLSKDVKDPLIRLSMSPGWGGPTLKLTLEESTNPEDTVTEVDGVKFVVALNQSTYFDNVQLDFAKSLFGLGGYKLSPA